LEQTFASTALRRQSGKRTAQRSLAPRCARARRWACVCALSGGDAECAASHRHAGSHASKVRDSSKANARNARAPLFEYLQCSCAAASPMWCLLRTVTALQRDCVSPARRRAGFRARTEFEPLRFGVLWGLFFLGSSGRVIRAALILTASWPSA
jgi:hypothetical protein